MLPIGKHINSIIQLALAQPLKAAGFVKQARVFRRTLADGGIEVVAIQGGKYNEGSRGEFTVDLGLYLPAIAALTGAAALENPQAWQCHIHTRIGHLMPHKQQDFWWPIDEHSNDAAIAAELQTAVIQHGLPWLAALQPAAFKTIGADFYRLPGGKPVLNPFHAAALCLLADAPEQARQRLLIGLENKPSSADAIRAFAERHGLTLD